MTIKKLTYYMLATWLMFSIATAQNQQLKEHLQKTLDEIRSHELAQNKKLETNQQNLIPGITAAVVFNNGQSIVLASGFSDVEKNIALTENARMLSGSTGKAFAGALATTLVLDGTLTLQQKLRPLYKNEPWFRLLPNNEDLCLRHILNHSSGLISYFEHPQFLEFMQKKSNPKLAGYNADFTMSFAQLMHYATNRDPLFPAGTQLSYSENGYLLVGYTIGKALCKSTNSEEIQQAYFTALNERILQPLQLKDTQPNLGRKFDNLAQGYLGNHPAISAYEKALDENNYLRFNPGFEFSGGGLVTTSLDLAKFILNVSQGKMYKDSNKAKQFATLFLTPSPRDKKHTQKFYGLGPVVIESKIMGTVMGHAGIIPGYSSLMYYFTKHNFAIAVQVNSSQNHHLSHYIRALAEQVIAQY